MALEETFLGSIAAEVSRGAGRQNRKVQVSSGGEEVSSGVDLYLHSRPNLREVDRHCPLP